MNLLTLAMQPMKTYTFTKNLLFAALTSIVIALSVTGCSDDEKKKTSHNPFDHSHDVPVTDIEKHKFEHDFAAQCVERELKNSVNKDEDKERFSKSCMCVATYMMKDLTAQEAEKFLKEHENPRSLQIKYDSAVYHCTQQKTVDKGFKTFETPKPKQEEGFFSKFF
ncbi:MAG: hypothetical protein CG441_1562 [Methylococcaceae bacterium NSM2-1]|nr:MAG: hypothetical protein CG441_1562 [Methylococcaceae bacterium NSM2-1]